MSKKILSLIIPTYNMESLLPRCLDSLLIKEILDFLEVIVVNDGSKDDSLRIANEYKNGYPNSVVVIDKPNGNYGSTINAALPIAQGKYVKIIDSDDWFNSDALITFIEKMKVVDCDMVVSHFSIIHENGTKELSKYNVYGKEVYEYDKVYDFDKVLSDGYIRFFLMHAIAYRTDLLRKKCYKQTEGISYTDTEWSAYPMFWVQSIVFFDINLYQYNLARDGQTMSPAVLFKSLSQLEKVTFQLISYYDSFDLSSLSEERLNFLQKYYRNRIRILYKCFLLDIPRANFDVKQFEVLDSKLSAICIKHNFLPIKLYPENKIVHIDALAYWHKNHKRFPIWFEKFNILMNAIMTKLYRVIFR